MLTKEEKLIGTLINIDLEKAFDSIEWDYIPKAFRFFNYPEKLIEWIMTFYSQ